MLTLKEIAAKLLGLETSLSKLAANKTEATDSALGLLTSELSALKTGAVATATKAEADLATANSTITAHGTNLEKANSDLKAVNTALKAACSEMNLEVKADATSADMISAMQGAVTSTLAKLQVDSSKVPAAPSTKAGEPPANGRKLSLDQEIKARQASQVIVTK